MFSTRTSFDALCLKTAYTRIVEFPTTFFAKPIVFSKGFIILYI